MAVTEANRNGRTAVKDSHARGLPVATKPQFPADRTMPLAQSVAQDDNGEFVSFVPDPSQAAANLLEAGLTLLESLSSRCSADVAERQTVSNRSNGTFRVTAERRANPTSDSRHPPARVHHCRTSREGD